MSRLYTSQNYLPLDDELLCIDDEPDDTHVGFVCFLPDESFLVVGDESGSGLLISALFPFCDMLRSIGGGVSDLALRAMSLAIHLIPRPTGGDELRGLFGNPMSLPLDDTLLIIGDGPADLHDRLVSIAEATGCCCWSALSTDLVKPVLLLSKRRPLQLMHLEEYLQS